MMRRNLLALASQVQQAAGVQQVSHGRLTSAPLEWPCDQQTRSLAMPCNADRGAHDAPQGLQELLAFTAAAAATRCQAAAAATTPLLSLGLHHSSSISVAAGAARQQQLQGALLPLAAAAAARQPGSAAFRCHHPHPQQARGYAQMGTKMPKSGYQPPPEMQKAMHLKMSMVSSGLLAEPFRGTPPRLPLTAYVTPSGWKQIWQRFLNSAKSLYTLAKCK